VEHDDAVMLWYLQGPDDSMESRAQAALTGQIISANYFEELRTEQQLGYVVSAFYWPLLDVPAVAMLIQSPGSTVPELLEASRAFLIDEAEPGALTGERFERHRAALLQDILKPDKNLWERSAYFWREITRDNPAFDSRQQIAEAVRGIDFALWQAWYRRQMLDEPASLVVAAPGRSGKLPEAETVIEDAPALQAARPFYLRQ
jgi:secreted Zn-dependent insulinase-like peptidase